MASIKCPACGLVNFADAQACRRCKGTLSAPMPSTERAADLKPGSGRTVLGPVTTERGFKGWHVVCLPDALITVPQSLLRTLGGAMTMAGIPAFGVVGVLLAHGASKGLKASGDPKVLLAQATEGQLRADAQNVIYPLAELVSISFKRSLLLKPEIRLERRGQGVTAFAVIVNAAFGEICVELKRLYPGLCRDIA